MAGFGVDRGSGSSSANPDSSISEALIDAKGDLIVGTADNVAARLAVGANDQTLVADSTQTKGVRWGGLPSVEWNDVGLTPTYISTISFSLVGDQTANYHVGRRVRITDAGGAKYARITASVFGAVTTVTLSGDTLATPTSAVALSIQAATNVSAPSGFITQAQITANQNDYAPGGLPVVRLNSDARRNVTGFSGGYDGRVLMVHNVGSFPIPFKYEDALSSAANRFAFACTLGGGQSLETIYDAPSLRWRQKHIPEPLGTIKDFGTSTMPEGFLAIDQNVSRATYAPLFNEIGTTWGAGDGSTTFGLYVGRGAGLIAAGTGTQTAAGVDADVDLAGNTLAVATNTNKWITGMAVVFALASGTITGLVNSTTYFVIRSSATLIQLASTLANAQNGLAIDFTAKSSPVWTVTHTYITRTHGQTGGEEAHAQSITELLGHTHGISDGNLSVGGANFYGVAASNILQSASRGGNAAMNIMTPFAVITRGVRYV